MVPICVTIQAILGENSLQDAGKGSAKALFKLQAEIRFLYIVWRITKRIETTFKR